MGIASAGVLGGPVGVEPGAGDVVDAANEALAKDARYLAKLDQMGDNFVDGSGRMRLLRRIA